MKTCSFCGRENSDAVRDCCDCGAVLAALPQTPAQEQTTQVVNGDVALQRHHCLAPYLPTGYKFASKRAELRLWKPLTSVLRQLNIRPKTLGQVERFMEQRLQELRSKKKSWSAPIYYVLLGVLAVTCTSLLCTIDFIFAWIITCLLLIPAGFLLLQLLGAGAWKSRPHAEWAQEEFWRYRKTRAHSKRPIPKEILMAAEEIQAELPSSRLTVWCLYEDAFLCARHPGVLGTDDEFYVVGHWGTSDFRE